MSIYSHTKTSQIETFLHDKYIGNKLVKNCARNNF